MTAPCRPSRPFDLSKTELVSDAPVQQDVTDVRAPLAGGYPGRARMLRMLDTPLAVARRAHRPAGTSCLAASFER